MKETEDLIQKAALHVNQAPEQRNYANSKVREAKEDKGKDHCDSPRCFVMDYAQNRCVPHLGNVQPGATYYYTPLRVNIFGLVDPTMNENKGHVDAYLYEERQGGKGADNVELFQSTIHCFMLGSCI